MPERGSLRISVAFPQGTYSGAEFGAAEDLPSPARLHDAFVAAAAGGPWATPDDRVLVAREEDRAALEWLERHEPLGVIPPETRLTVARARRYRWRASPVNPADSDFEPRSALAGPVVYVWPDAPEDVAASLSRLAPEVTHLGRADSVVIVDVAASPPTDHEGLLHEIAPGRGPGRVMRVAAPGRMSALAQAHREASARGTHSPGSLGRQAYDQQVTGANETATVLRRFATSHSGADWPFDEVWVLPISADRAVTRSLLQSVTRVPAAVGIHRAIVRAIGEDVPAFVTGRDGDGPLRGAGHLAIHVTTDDRTGGPVALLGMPADVPDADRELLRTAIARPLRAAAGGGRGAGRWFALGRPQVRSALPFWMKCPAVMRTESPLVLDATGRPRRGAWSVEDAVVCSIGYAMRGVLERAGLPWGAGWSFRSELVATLRREYAVAVAVRRTPVAASRFVHRVAQGELVVAVDALVDLGRLAPIGGGFLALGRSRHLGGGLLVPARGDAA